jgi:hypothetical protein
MANQLTQPAQAFVDKNGKPMPLLRAKTGAGKSVALTTTPNAALQIHSADYNVPVRIWAVGCAVNYIIGASGVGTPSATADGYIGQDRAVETYMTPEENYIRVAAVTGTGTLRIEVLY